MRIGSAPPKNCGRALIALSVTAMRLCIAALAARVPPSKGRRMAPINQLMRNKEKDCET
jgi:hypothetical protein